MKTTTLVSLAVLATILSGTLLSAIWAMQVAKTNHQRVESALSTSANKIADEILTRFKLYQYGLRGARGAVATVGEHGINQELFLRYSRTRNVDGEFPGALGFGFIRRVTEQDEAVFVAAVRRDGLPNFSVLQLAPHEGDRYVVQYIEPMARNRASIGLDIASEKNRKTAADEARDSGEVRLTGPITLVQASGQQHQSFLILLPIYRGVDTPGTKAERQTMLYGWSYAPLIIGEILDSLDIDKNTMKLILQDVTPSTMVEEFYHSSADGKVFVAKHSAHLQREIFGRTWRMEFQVNSNFVNDFHLSSPFSSFYIGVLFSFLISAIVGSLMFQNEKKRKIFAAKSQLSAIVDSSIDAIISKDLTGSVISWNKGAERLFNYSEDAVVGKKLIDLIVPKDQRDEEEAILAAIARGEVVENFNTVRERRDGTLVSVSVAVSPVFDEQGVVIGASKTARDITEQIESKKKIMELNVNLSNQVHERTKQLEMARRSLETVLDAMPSMIGYWDKDLINRVANRAYHEWYGVSPHSIPGKRMCDLMDVDQFVELQRYLEPALLGHRQIFEKTMSFSDQKKQRHVLSHFIPDHEGGEVQGIFVIVHDVSEITEGRIQLSSALRENQALITAINQQMMYSVTDIEGNIIEVNDNFCAASGYSRAELIGQNHRILNSGIHTNEFWEKLWRSILDKEIWQDEIVNRNKSGELQWYDTSIIPYVNEAGQIERLVALRNNITQRVLAEAERNRLGLLFSNVLNSTSEMAILITNPEGIIEIFNSGAEKMLGYRAAEVVGKFSPIQFHSADELKQAEPGSGSETVDATQKTQVEAYISHVIQAESQIWTYIKKNGGQVKVSLAVTEIQNSNHQSIGYLSIATDVTKQLYQQRELQSSVHQLAIASRVAELGIWTWHLTSNTLQWNDRMYEMYDQPLTLREDGLSYQHWTERVHPDDLADTEASLLAAVRGLGTYDPIFRIVLPGGRVRYIQAGAQVEYDLIGEPIKVTGINRDITEQYEVKAQLIYAKETADAANRAKSLFLATMSHEIRTPMNGVIGMLHLLGREPLSDQQQKYLIMAENSASALTSLINDILDFSKIEAGKLELDSCQFDLFNLIDDTCSSLAITAFGKGLEFVLDLVEVEHFSVIGDDNRIRQVLVNLVSNAIKFTQHGSIIVFAKTQRVGDDAIEFTCAIRDTGVGIAAEKQEHIFQSFSQEDSTTTRKYGGTGLGLAIAKKLCQIMGGDITLDSKVGLGSTFTFTVVVNPHEEQVKIEFNHVAEKGMQYLLADPEEVTRSALAKIVSRFGENIFSGSELSAKWKNNLSPGCFTICFYNRCAVNMNAPLFNVDEEQKICFVELIQDHQKPTNEDHFHLAKPFTPRSVYRLMANIFEGRGLGQWKNIPEVDVDKKIEAELEALLKQFTGKKVLLVDDNAINLEVGRGILEGYSLKVEVAHDGREAINMLSQQGEDGDPYSVVLMDCQMPILDGIEATKEIRQGSAGAFYQSIPIIAMTANAMAGSQDNCLAIGMNDYLSKPIDPIVLGEKLLFWLDLSNNTLRLKPNVKSKEAAPSPGAVEWNNFGSIVWDQAGAMKRVRDKRERLHTLIDMFVSDTPERIENLLYLFARGDNVNIAKVAHQIKGTSGNIGGMRLFGLTSALEAAANNSDQEALERMVASIEFEYKELRNKLIIFKSSAS